MAKNEPIRRYFLEIEKLNRKGFPSIDDVIIHLENRGIYKNKRTIERDFEQIRNNFGIQIEYNPQERGYFINEEYSVNPAAFFRFLELANTSQLLLSELNESKEFLSNIDFDLRGGFKGTENLQAILQAIKHQQSIKITHQSFYRENQKEVIINPYLLKEYQSRWYVAGFQDDINDFRTYGLDRIINVEILSTKFERIRETQLKENFEKIIGLVYSFYDQEKVILSFSPNQGKYIKSLPMHRSQKVLIDNEKELRISLFIIPNYEFYQQILMYGSEVTVLEPVWLRDEIKDKIMAALKNYKS